MDTVRRRCGWCIALMQKVLLETCRLHAHPNAPLFLSLFVFPMPLAQPDWLCLPGSGAGAERLASISRFRFRDMRCSCAISVFPNIHPLRTACSPAGAESKACAYDRFREYLDIRNLLFSSFSHNYHPVPVDTMFHWMDDGTLATTCAAYARLSKYNFATDKSTTFTGSRESIKCDVSRHSCLLHTPRLIARLVSLTTASVGVVTLS